MPPQTKEPDTFLDGPIDGVVFRALEGHADRRGWLIELYRSDEMAPEQLPAMAYVSETLPGQARGPHAHAEQSDYFAFVGPGEFMLYCWDIRVGSPSWGRRVQVAVGESNKQSVVVPAGVVHGYRNIGPVPGWVFNAPNRLYAGPGKRQPVDEVRYEDRLDDLFRML